MRPGARRKFAASSGALVLSGALFMPVGSGTGLGLSSTPRSARTAVADLPFPVAYTTVSASGTGSLWVAGKGRRPTRVAGPNFSPPSWSGNGRYLVAVINPYGSSRVWRYDDATGSVRTWRCDGCEQATAIGDEIVAVDSKLQLVRFPLDGGSAERPLAITGRPSWSRSRYSVGAVPEAVGGTDTTAFADVANPGWCVGRLGDFRARQPPWALLTDRGRARRVEGGCLHWPG